MRHVFKIFVICIGLNYLGGGLKGSPPPVASPSEFQLAEGVKLELVAQAPDIVTPIGLDRDPSGKLYVVLSHTHQRPESYKGPQHDQILVVDPATGKTQVFYEGTTHTTHLRVGQEGWVYVMERSQVLRLRDTDGDGRVDQRQVIFRLITVTDYPHNGLGDLAWHPDGGMIFTLGENFGESWDLVGTDSKVLSGTGEGGVFYAKRDGSGLRRVAKGFWNPFGVTVTKDGEIFVAENDPGSRPPCRLLHVVEGADYGFQWNYGRDPFHPFVAWNGELRGTIGMIRPVGEGPSSILQLGGGMIVPSWSQHKVEYFPLKRQGQGFEATRKLLIQGPEDFRPVTVIRADERTYYFTDWVSGAYAVHGQGRLWKMTVDPGLATWVQSELEAAPASVRAAHQWRQGKSMPVRSTLLKLARSQDPYQADAALQALYHQLKNEKAELLEALDPNDQVTALVAMRRGDLQNTTWLEGALKHAKLHGGDADLWFEALRWIADGKLERYLPEVETRLQRDDLSYPQFEAALACLNTLQGNSRLGLLNPEVIAEKLKDSRYSASTQAYLLRLMPPQNKLLSESNLQAYLENDHEGLRIEAIRKLQGMVGSHTESKLLSMLQSDRASEAVKLEVVQTLATLPSPKTLIALQQVAQSSQTTLAKEAARALRFTEQDRHFSVATDRPSMEDVAAWLKRLEQIPGPRDLEQGKRLFFHSKVAMCASCHRYEGRGGLLGPDLSLVHEQGDARWILDSILNPNREVAPQFYPSKLELADGETFFGILLRSSHVDTYRNLAGREHTFKKEQVIRREELPMSLMPPQLVNTMTDEELADLLAFLTQKP